MVSISLGITKCSVTHNQVMNIQEIENWITVLTVMDLKVLTDFSRSLRLQNLILANLHWNKSPAN